MISLFISPHSKKIGETYILPKLLSECEEIDEVQFALYNVAGEWDDLGDDYLVINNPLKSLMRYIPNIEKISPWLNYRVWLAFVSLSIVVSLPSVILRLLRSNEKVIIIGRMATSSIGFVGFLFTFNKSVKFVASMAGVPLPSKIRSIFWPIIYKNFDAIVCPCSTMVSYVAELTKVPDTLFSVIPNPVLHNGAKDFAKEKIEARSFDRNIDYKWRLLSVGRLTRQKGLDTLIKSLELVQNSVELSIIGEGEDEKKLKDYVFNSSADVDVKFLGYKNDPFHLGSNFDIFVMPSRWEGPGHTIIEALAVGLPSIVSNCRFGPEETVGFGKYGHVFEVDNCEGLSTLIDKVISTYSNNKDMLLAGADTLEQYEPKHVSNTWKKLLPHV